MVLCLARPDQSFPSHTQPVAAFSLSFSFSGVFWNRSLFFFFFQQVCLFPFSLLRRCLLKQISLFFFSKKLCFCIFVHEVKPGQAPSISFGNSFCRKDLSLLRSKRQTWGSINILLKLGSRRPTLVLIQMHPAAAAARRRRLVFRKMGFGSILFRVISVQKAFSPFRTLLRIKVKSKAKLSRSDKSSFLFTLTFGNKLQNRVWEGKFS